VEVIVITEQEEENKAKLNNPGLSEK